MINGAGHDFLGVQYVPRNLRGCRGDGRAKRERRFGAKRGIETVVRREARLVASFK